VALLWFVEFELRFLIPRVLITRKITYKWTCADEVYRLQSVKIKQMGKNDGCNRSLNVFQPTPPLYYNNGVCQYKMGSRHRLHIYSVQYSQTAIFFNFSD
jgi:hypothetical protein